MNKNLITYLIIACIIIPIFFILISKNNQGEEDTFELTFIDQNKEENNNMEQE